MQNRNPQATISVASHSRNSNCGIGNPLQRSRKMITVGLYTARKPVEASSIICSANATHSANQALPKPGAESAGAALTTIRPSHEFSITHRTIGNRKSVFEGARMGTSVGLRGLPRHFTHQCQQVSFRIAKKRHP